MECVHKNYVTTCILCLGQSIDTSPDFIPTRALRPLFSPITDTPRGFVPTRALCPASLCLTTVSIRDNFAPADRILESCRNYIAACILYLGQSIDMSCDFVPTHALHPDCSSHSRRVFTPFLDQNRQLQENSRTSFDMQRNFVPTHAFHLGAVGGHQPEYRWTSTIVGRETCLGRHVSIPKAPKIAGTQAIYR
ncbi:Hypothetical predicted protein [Olea europaea subsp. europaea]|uniref:Uncharacterized protein n=1 Tax=Olea europaea subsp. europaea TaxID=158383 RepID=A0A8S0SN12_OLEEU|nr:Hypothetical predicted protein [Olea europaea subsp. europaea]